MTDTPQRMTAAEAAREWLLANKEAEVQMIVQGPPHRRYMTYAITPEALATFSERVRGEPRWWDIILVHPDDGARVLVWIDLTGLHVTNRSYARIACWGPTGFTDGHASTSIANVTHWMPLPSSPTTEPTRTITESEKGG